MILSGASSGIGFELAELLAVRCGCTVIGIGRRELEACRSCGKDTRTRREVRIPCV